SRTAMVGATLNRKLLVIASRSGTDSAGLSLDSALLTCEACTLSQARPRFARKSLFSRAVVDNHLPGTGSGMARGASHPERPLRDTFAVLVVSGLVGCRTWSGEARAGFTRRRLA